VDCWGCGGAYALPAQFQKSLENVRATYTHHSTPEMIHHDFAIVCRGHTIVVVAPDSRWKREHPLHRNCDV
jgi:hypothetical protein